MKPFIYCEHCMIVICMHYSNRLYRSPLLTSFFCHYRLNFNDEFLAHTSCTSISNVNNALCIIYLLIERDRMNKITMTLLDPTFSHCHEKKQPL